MIVKIANQTKKMNVASDKTSLLIGSATLVSIQNNADVAVQLLPYFFRFGKRFFV